MKSLLTTALFLILAAAYSQEPPPDRKAVALRMKQNMEKAEQFLSSNWIMQGYTTPNGKSLVTFEGPTVSFKDCTCILSRTMVISEKRDQEFRERSFILDEIPLRKLLPEGLIEDKINGQVVFNDLGRIYGLRFNADKRKRVVKQQRSSVYEMNGTTKYDQSNVLYNSYAVPLHSTDTTYLAKMGDALEHLIKMCRILHNNDM